MNLLLPLIFLGLAAMSKSCMDVFITQSKWEKTIFKPIVYKTKNKFWRNFWSYIDMSYVNKYKDIRSLEPKFVGSTTIFVFLTDAWHFFQFLTYAFLFIAIVTNMPQYSLIIDFIILRVFFGITFSLTYYLLVEETK
jgi:hypothetical protein